MQQLPAQLQLHCFSFLDGVELTTVLAAAKWALSEEKTDRLFQSALMKRCGEDAALMFVAKSGNNRWKRAFKDVAVSDRNWHKGALQLFHREWTRRGLRLQMSSTRIFERNVVGSAPGLTAWQLPRSGNWQSYRLPANARITKLRGEETLIELHSPSQLNVLDVDGKLLRTIALSAELSSPTVAFGRFFGFCAADRAIHAHSLETGELECKLDISETIKLGGSLHSVLPLSASCILLDCGNYRGHHKLLINRTSTTKLQLPKGSLFATNLTVSQGLCCILRDGSVWLLREQALAQGFRKIADVGELPFPNFGKACVREPTRDLIIIVLLYGEIIALDVRAGRIARHETEIALEGRNKDQSMILSIAAWGSRVAVVTHLSSGCRFLAMCGFS